VVSITNVKSSIEVVKTASPSSLTEPGGKVTFTIKVINKSTVDDVSITSLADNVHTTVNLNTLCNLPRTIPKGGSNYFTCSFQADVTGNAGYVETDTVTASGVDDDNDPVSDMDTATVTILNVAPTAKLDKTATSAIVTFDVVVTNTSNAADPLTLSSLIDDVAGTKRDITVVDGTVIVDTDCTVPQTIQPGDHYACKFQAVVNASQTDTVTGTLSDGDTGSQPIKPADSASVTLQ
jgi:hypothetical protein